MITMYLKIHENPQGKIIAVCDKDLIGRILKDKTRHLDLDRYRGFYMGKQVEEEIVRTALGDFLSANIVGKKAVKIALDMGIAKEKDVMNIDNVPYIQIYRV
ncbi:DUF424 family protein [Candidatus Micrarchaeota archaeon]|nr:DUF424 family protein [Candidatus Micrarchaeota archaeon]